MRPITLQEITGTRKLRGPAQAVWLYIMDYHLTAKDGVGLTLSRCAELQVLYAPEVGQA